LASKCAFHNYGTELIDDVQTSDARQPPSTGQELYLLRNGYTPLHRWGFSVSVLREGTPSRTKSTSLRTDYIGNSHKSGFPLR
jgi:hypothetical protein